MAFVCVQVAAVFCSVYRYTLVVLWTFKQQKNEIKHMLNVMFTMNNFSRAEQNNSYIEFAFWCRENVVGAFKEQIIWKTEWSMSWGIINAGKIGRNFLSTIPNLHTVGLFWNHTFKSGIAWPGRDSKQYVASVSLQHVYLLISWKKGEIKFMPSTWSIAYE